MRIDMHAHYMPPTLPVDRDLLVREPYWEYLVNPKSAKSVQGWATVERMIDDMDRAGIDRIVLQGEYYSSHESAVHRNTQVLELVRRWPERISAFAAIQPRAGPPALAELERCLDEGMCGAGEVSPYAQGFTLQNPDFLRMVELCISRDVPMLVHSNEQVGHHYPGKVPTPLWHYYELAARYPELKLVLAHWGGGLFLYELMPEVKKTLANVWYDTAASPLVFPTTGIFRAALQCIPPDKILYASDYPLLLYPRTQREPGFHLFLSEVEQLDLDPLARENICGHNAARLLGLLPNASAAVNAHTTPGRSIPRIENFSPGIEITEKLAVSWVASTFPRTQAVFDKFGLPWRDSPVPFWEPILQSACARGLDVKARQRLLMELNQAANDN